MVRGFELDTLILSNRGEFLICERPVCDKNNILAESTRTHPSTAVIVVDKWVVQSRQEEDRYQRESDQNVLQPWSVPDKNRPKTHPKACWMDIRYILVGKEEEEVSLWPFLAHANR